MNNLNAAACQKQLEADVVKPSDKKQINRHADRCYWPAVISHKIH